MRKRIDAPFAVFLAACFCYLLIIISYVIDSLAMNSFTQEIITVIPYILLSVITGLLFILQAKYHKPFFSGIAFVLSAIKLILFFASFFILDMQNLKAVSARMAGTATSPATAGDVVFFVCTIIMAVIVLAAAFLENIAFLMSRKKEFQIKKN